MVKLEFFKICAGGNDFIVIDNRKKIFSAEHQDNLVEMMCARRYAIGAEGVCFIESSNCADYQVRFFSSNGSELDFSANGIRAATRFANQKEIAGNVQNIETKSGIVKGDVGDDLISVEVPNVKKLEIKHELEIPHQFENKVIELSFVDFGSKHLVLKVEKVATFDVRGVGYMLNSHVQYQPEGINVSFYDVIDNHNINVATFETGVKSLVNSSGDGALSSFIIAETRKEINAPAIIHTWGGLLKISHKEDRLFMEGEARVAFDGFITADMLNFDIEKVRKRHFV